MAAAPLQPLLTEDPAWWTAACDRLTGAAGLDATQTSAQCGPPGPALVALGRSQDAALIIVSASDRTWLHQAISPSVTGNLVRRSGRPVLVCPRHPAPAMRLRAALDDTPQRAREGS